MPVHGGVRGGASVRLCGNDPHSEASKSFLLRSKQDAKFFYFLDENRLIFVDLSDHFQNIF